MSTPSSPRRLSYFRALIALGFLIASGYCFHRVPEWRRKVDSWKLEPLCSGLVELSKLHSTPVHFMATDGIAHGMVVAVVPADLAQKIPKLSVDLIDPHGASYYSEPRFLDERYGHQDYMDGLRWLNRLPSEKVIFYHHSGIDPGEQQLVLGPLPVESNPCRVRIAVGYVVCGCEYFPMFVYWAGGFLFLLIGCSCVFAGRGLASTRPNLDDNYGPLFGTGETPG